MKMKSKLARTRKSLRRRRRPACIAFSIASTRAAQNNTMGAQNEASRLELMMSVSAHSHNNTVLYYALLARPYCCCWRRRSYCCSALHHRQSSSSSSSSSSMPLASSTLLTSHENSLQFAAASNACRLTPERTTYFCM